MPKSRPPYAAEFRRRMVELVRSGRDPEDLALAREFEPTAQSIRNWVAQSERDEGVREDGLTTVEREELRRLRRENRQLREEREILKSSGLVRSGERVVWKEAFGFVGTNQAMHGVRTMCRLLGVSPSGFTPNASVPSRSGPRRTRI
jgi:transposase